jgi:hypothetical protein
MSNVKLFIGLDVHKATIAMSAAEDGRNGEVRYIGNFANNPMAIISAAHRSAAATVRRIPHPSPQRRSRNGEAGTTEDRRLPVQRQVISKFPAQDLSQ